MDPMPELIARQREDATRHRVQRLDSDLQREPLRRRTARHLHRIARAIDVNDV